MPANIGVWTEQGFTKLVRVIRHRTTKNIFRVLTHTGCIDVTEDHSLLGPHGDKISPSNLRIGDQLLHNELPASDLRDRIAVVNTNKYYLDFKDKLQRQKRITTCHNIVM